MVEKYLPVLNAFLDYKRVEHSLYVSDKCVFLAKKLNCDTGKARIAGLLHDITKNFSDEEHLEYFEKYGYKLTDVEKASPKIWHSISGALFVKYDLKIDDEDILNAIRYHTTGRKNMSQLEKIVYLADCISDDRKYDSVGTIRSITNYNFDDGMIFALKLSMEILSTEDNPIHPGTLDAYNDIVLRREKVESF